MAEPELTNACEFIKDRLYFTSLRTQPRRSLEYHYFCTDNELVYEPFFDDFGPLNLAMLYRFVCHLADKLKDRALADKKIVYYSSMDVNKRAVAACLIGCFSIIHLKQTPEEAFRPLMCANPPFKHFKDVYGGSWNCTLIDCFRALDTAMTLGWFRMDTFNVQEYEYYERVENGDLNAIVPGRFVAFSGPAAKRTDVSLGPEDYIPILKRFGVTAVVRLNKKVYDRKKFLDAGIKHYDLYFVDGGNPSEAILKQWLDIVENEPGAVGIHCKAGLGRTGVLNACFLMKHYRITANELIAWFRMCRPGSVIGPQQQFIKEMEAKMWAEGDAYREQNGMAPPAGGPELALPPPDWYERDCPTDAQEDELIDKMGRMGLDVPSRPALSHRSPENRHGSYATQPASPVRGMYGVAGSSRTTTSTYSSGYSNYASNRSAGSSARPEVRSSVRPSAYSGARSSGSRYY
eukprot:TRINITY_DN6137_c0_g1_i1.p1 TRINITY_DN6137_c0_g1~~TRINITY_DN6137_c0_g1_i1.p1  ORF type:complete len:461 (-),score=71.52 TRINITY_DN6137_c0_g1_i1:227-1609(-)